MLLQLNPEKKVEYSSEKTFAKGDILELDEDGRIEQNGYEGVAKKNIYGFYTVLLLPTYEYQSGNLSMDPADRKRDFISLAILAVVAISQIWLVSHPIKVLEKKCAILEKEIFLRQRHRFSLRNTISFCNVQSDESADSGAD